MSFELIITHEGKRAIKPLSAVEARRELEGHTSGVDEAIRALKATPFAVLSGRRGAVRWIGKQESAS